MRRPARPGELCCPRRNKKDGIQCAALLAGLAVRRVGKLRLVAIACIAAVSCSRIGEARHPGPLGDLVIHDGIHEPFGYLEHGAAAHGSARAGVGLPCDFDDPEGHMYDGDFGDEGCDGNYVAAPPSGDESGVDDVAHDCDVDDFADALPEFMRAGKFDGARQGYCYRVGDKGLGYYRDVTAWLHAAGPRAADERRNPSGGAHAVLCLSDLLPVDGTDIATMLGEVREGTTEVPERFRAAADGAGNDVGGAGDAAARHGRERRPRCPKSKRRRKGHGAFDLPEECSVGDRAHRAAGYWAFDSVNPNAWTGAEKHLRATSADFVAIQETKRRGRAREQAERTAGKFGWSVSLCEAIATEASGTSAGVGLAARAHLGMAQGSGRTEVHTGGRYDRKWIGSCCKGGLHWCNGYFHTAQDLSDGNIGLLELIAEDLMRLRGPWILAGDFNMTADVLARSGWLSLVGGVAITPSTPTCNGGGDRLLRGSREHCWLHTGGGDDR